MLGTEKLFRVIGLQRSGTHAIGHWLLFQFDGIKYHHLEMAAGSAQYSFYLLNNSSCLLFLNNRKLGQSIVYDDKQHYLDLLMKIGEKYVKHAVITHENVFPWKFVYENVIDINKGLGKIADERFILILRDPYNWLASLIVHLGRPDIPYQHIEVWKAYAREILGLTNYIPDKIIINYNRWVSETSYRKSICSALNIKFTDEAYTAVTSHGSGSSFDGTKFDGRANEMELFKRWKKFEKLEKFKQIFQHDKELVMLSRMLYGCLPAEQILSA